MPAPPPRRGCFHSKRPISSSPSSTAAPTCGWPASSSGSSSTAAFTSSHPASLASSSVGCVHSERLISPLSSSSTAAPTSGWLSSSLGSSSGRVHLQPAGLIGFLLRPEPPFSTPPTGRSPPVLLFHGRANLRLAGLLLGHFLWARMLLPCEPSSPILSLTTAPHPYMDCRVGLRWHFCCGCPNSKPRPVLDFSSKKSGVIFFLRKVEK